MTFYLSECVAAYFGRFYIAQIRAEAKAGMDRAMSKKKYLAQIENSCRQEEAISRL